MGRTGRAAAGSANIRSSSACVNTLSGRPVASGPAGTECQNRPPTSQPCPSVCATAPAGSAADGNCGSDRGSDILVVTPARSASVSSRVSEGLACFTCQPPPDIAPGCPEDPTAVYVSWACVETSVAPPAAARASVTVPSSAGGAAWFALSCTRSPLQGRQGRVDHRDVPGQVRWHVGEHAQEASKLFGRCDVAEPGPRARVQRKRGEGLERDAVADGQRQPVFVADEHEGRASRQLDVRVHLQD